MLIFISAFGLQVKQLFVEGSVLLIECVVVVAFFQQSLSLSFEVLLGHFGFFFLDAFLALEVFFGDVGVLLQSALVVFLGALDLVFDVFLATASQSLQLTFDFLLLQFLAVALDGELLLEATACVQLLGDGAHQ